MDTLFQVLVENSSDAIVMLNADGTIGFASESSARLLGYTLDERRGRSAFELMHGEGIDPDMQPHIFEPFFATKGPSKGTGLGLSIVYGIVKDAGGTVSFSTAPNEGTTFEVLMPLVAGG